MLKCVLLVVETLNPIQPWIELAKPKYYFILQSYDILQFCQYRCQRTEFILYHAHFNMLIRFNTKFF